MKTLPKHIQREARLDAANALIEVIAANGRQFFASRHPDGPKTAYMGFSNSGYIRWWEEYNRTWIYVSRPPPWRGFTHGSGLRWFVEQLVQFIRSGVPLSPDEFGKNWGYEEISLSTVIQAGQQSGVISPANHGQPLPTA